MTCFRNRAQHTCPKRADSHSPSAPLPRQKFQPRRPHPPLGRYGPRNKHRTIGSSSGTRANEARHLDGMRAARRRTARLRRRRRSLLRSVPLRSERLPRRAGRRMPSDRRMRRRILLPRAEGVRRRHVHVGLPRRSRLSVRDGVPARGLPVRMPLGLRLRSGPALRPRPFGLRVVKTLVDA